MKEFENESLTMLRGHLFCSACHEQLSLKRRMEKARNDMRVKRRGSAPSLNICGNTMKKHIQGGKPCLKIIKVVTAFLKSGVPLSKVESFRDLLEENAFRLTDRCNLLNYVPFILKEEELYSL